MNITKIEHKKEDWQQKAQEGEFKFHKTNKWRQSEDFMKQTKKLFDHFGFDQDSFQGKTIIDLGSGSKMRCKYFKNAELICIEPLADRFVKEIKWCDLLDADGLYSVPAEVFVNECENKADLVISINVLDHCYNFENIVENVFKYLKKDGIAFLSFDKHDVSDEMHPLKLNEEICKDIFYKKGFEINSLTKGCGQILKTYGHGEYCLNYKLTKRTK